MESPVFFDRQREQFLALWDPATPPFAVWADDRPEIMDGPTDPFVKQQRRLRLLELIDQTVIAADLAVPSETTALKVWADALLKYGTSQRSPLITTVTTSGGDESEGEHPYIADLARLSADFCEHLKTRAMSASRDEPVPVSTAGAPSTAGHISASTGPTRWEDIEIRFLSDHSVQIYRSGKPAEVRNFAEMGFGDGRKKQGVPTTAWAILRALSAEGRLPAPIGPPRARLEKRIAEIRKALKRVLGVEDDPIFLASGFYQPRFKISRSAADQFGDGG